MQSEIHETITDSKVEIFAWQFDAEHAENESFWLLLMK